MERPSLRLEVHPFIGECTLSYLLSATLKDCMNSVWSVFPDPGKSFAASDLFRQVLAALTEQIAACEELTSVNRIESRAVDILSRIAARYEDKDGAGRWRPVAEVIRNTGIQRLRSRLEACAASKEPDRIFSPDYAESLDRSLQLYQRFLASISATSSLPPPRKVECILVSLSKDGDNQPVSTRGGELNVRYVPNASSLLRHFALPLYFFHEIMSHLVPQKDLSAVCADGWLMEAAKIAWERLVSIDRIVYLERLAISSDIAQFGDRLDLLARYESPFALAARVFSSHFPDTFWPLTFDLMRGAAERPLEQLVVANLTVFLVDGQDLPLKATTWLQELGRIIPRPWSGLELFSAHLRQTRAQLEKLHGLPGFEH